MYIFICMELGRVYVGSIGTFLAFVYKRARKANLCKYKAGRCSMDRVKEHLGRILWAIKKSTQPNVKYRRWGGSCYVHPDGEYSCPSMGADTCRSVYDPRLLPS